MPKKKKNHTMKDQVSQKNDGAYLKTDIQA